jgi:hypothetical protein
MVKTRLLSLAEQLSSETALALRNAQIVISLSAYEASMNRDGYHRRYLSGTCEDGSKGLFLTTNEVHDDPFSSRALGEHFTVLDGFTGLLEDLIANSPMNYFEDSVHQPPKYVHYDIELMDDHFKPLFLAHLNKEVGGLAEDYVCQHFSTADLERITYWKNYLKCDAH